jgi:hypothetical protein
MNDLQGILANFISLHQERVQPPPHARTRAALKARLWEEGHKGSTSPSWLPATFLSRQLVGACIAMLIVAGSVWAMRDIALQLLDADASNQLASALPRKRLTPGAIHAIRIDDLCGNQDFDKDPPVSPSIQQAVFREYGVPVSSKDSYQVDYLISPTLGGTDDIRNLWPEPYSLTSWGAHAKDDLEDHLHEMVCQGKLPLATAQNEIAGDWIAAYKRYFHTDQPVTNAATLAFQPDYDVTDKPLEVSALENPAL